MRKLIFLDIDGVLNYAECKARVDGSKSIIGIEDECLENLKHIINETGAEIVLSSSWRNLNHDGNCYKYMLKKFEKYGLKISGQTGNDKYHHRQKEIMEYVKNLKEPVKFIAIDDEFFDEFEKREIPFVTTYFDSVDTRFDGKGLTKEKAQEAIEKLNN